MYLKTDKVIFWGKYLTKQQLNQHKYNAINNRKITDNLEFIISLLFTKVTSPWLKNGVKICYSFIILLKKSNNLTSIQTCSFNYALPESALRRILPMTIIHSESLIHFSLPFPLQINLLF